MHSKEVLMPVQEFEKMESFKNSQLSLR